MELTLYILTLNDMGFLKNQSDVSGMTPMPTDRTDDASTVTPVPAETVTWFYLTSSAWASATGQAAGTICTGKLAFTGILNSMNTNLGSSNDTSLSWGAAARVSTLKSVPASVFSQMVYMTPTEQNAEITKWLTTNGEYTIDHRRGQVWMISKDTVADDAASYDYSAPVQGASGPTANVAIVSALPAGTNLIGEVDTKPIEPSNSNTGAYATSLVIKGSAGTTYEIRGYNSGAAQWIQVHDASSLPADTAVPEDIFYVNTLQNFSITYPQGKTFATGIVVCNSSTGPAKTIGGADCWFSAEYI